MMNSTPQPLPTEAFVLPELTLIPFEPGQHMVTIARMDRPVRDIGGTSFPNVLISVLPGPGQATFENGNCSWLTGLGESVVVDVRIPGAILVFLTIRPTDYETTGLHIKIKKIEPNQDVAQPVQAFGQPQVQPAGAYPKPGVSPFGQVVTAAPQHISTPVSPFPASAQAGTLGTNAPFTTQATEKRFQGQPGFVPQPFAGPGQSLQAQSSGLPPFGAKPFGQMETPVAQVNEVPHETSPFVQATPGVPTISESFIASPGSENGEYRVVTRTPASPHGSESSCLSSSGPKPFGLRPSSFAQAHEADHEGTQLPQAKPFANVFGAGNATPGQRDDNMFAYSPGSNSAPECARSPQHGNMTFGHMRQPTAPSQPPIQAASGLPQAKPFASMHGNGDPQSVPGHGQSGAYAYTTPVRQVIDPARSTQVQPQPESQSAKSFAPLFPSALEVAPVQVHACGHIQNKGDVPCSPGQSVGVPSSQLKLEAVAFKPEGIDPAQFEYATVSQDGRLSPWTSFPHFSGSRGSSMPLLGFVARLTGDAAEMYQVVYSGTFLKAGQTPEVRDGQFLHSSIQGDALESLNLRIAPKN
jgi:hypothetical protein